MIKSSRTILINKAESRLVISYYLHYPQSPFHHCITRVDREYSETVSRDEKPSKFQSEKQILLRLFISWLVD